MKHFYGIFDYDQEFISFGVNLHSEDRVKMHGAGVKPQKQASTGTEAYATAASSESLAGKTQPEGVPQYDG